MIRIALAVDAVTARARLVATLLEIVYAHLGRDLAKQYAEAVDAVDDPAPGEWAAVLDAILETDPPAKARVDRAIEALDAAAEAIEKAPPSVRALVSLH